MTIESELVYLRHREVQANELGHASGDSAVKAIHFKLAEEYAARIDEIERKNPE
jgi:hypothetical protein